MPQKRTVLERSRTASSASDLRRFDDPESRCGIKVPFAMGVQLLESWCECDANQGSTVKRQSRR